MTRHLALAVPLTAFALVLAPILAASAVTLRVALPQAAAFNPATSRASAQQHASMVRIRGGSYTIGAPAGDSRSADDATPAHAVTVAAFRIDRTEVTTAQFAEFLNALPIKPLGVARGGKATGANFAPADRSLFIESLEPRSTNVVIGLDDDEARIGVRDGRFVPDPGFDEHPVAETTWAAAGAYCAWRGARLPTEAEWEAAARGTAGRVYPWGSAEPTTELATIRRRAADTLPVGSAPKGATPEGLLDMAGSLAEWTSTLYRPYPYRADDGREDLATAGERVTRGGDYAYQSGPEHLVTWHRRGFSRQPTSGHRHIGFRCAANG